MSGNSASTLPALRARERFMGEACRRVAALHERGLYLEPAWVKVAAEFHGRALPGGRVFLCSVGTLKRYWYRSAAGMNPEAFQDRRCLHKGESKIPASVVVGLNRYALQSGMTCRAIFKALGGAVGLGFSYPTLCRIIGAAVKGAARGRRQVQRLCVVLENRLQEGIGNAENIEKLRWRQVSELGGTGARRGFDTGRVCAARGCGGGSACGREKTGRSACGGDKARGLKGAGAPNC